MGSAEDTVECVVGEELRVVLSVTAGKFQISLLYFTLRILLLLLLYLQSVKPFTSKVNLIE